MTTNPLLRLLTIVLTAGALLLPTAASAHPRGGHGPHGPGWRVPGRSPGWVARRPRVWVPAHPRYRVVLPPPVIVVPPRPPVVVVPSPRYRYEVAPPPAPPESPWESEEAPAAPEPEHEARPEPGPVVDPWGDLADDPDDGWDGVDPWRADDGPPAPPVPHPPSRQGPDEAEPPPAPAPPPEPAAPAQSRHDVDPDAAALEAEIVRLVNVERQRAGLAPVQAAPALAAPARRHSREMLELGYFSHTSPVREHAEFTDRLRLAGVRDYGVAGENLAMRTRGPNLAAKLVQMWMDSPGHRANILEPRFRYLGVGVHGDDQVVYATQLFTSKLNGR